VPLTGGLGADAVRDCVGGSDFLHLSTLCVRLGGAIAVLSARITQDGFDLKMNTLSFIFGELNMVGVPGCGRRNQELCMRLLGEGKIKPVIDKVFALSQAAEAHAYLESRKHVGKVLLKP
jgi:putative oxidoreductase